MLGAEGAYLVLGEVRMHLDLVDRGVTSDSLASRRMWCGLKFDTPIERARPSR